MKLRRLCKSGDSRIEGDCPAVYIDDHDPAVMAAQGALISGAATGLRDVAAHERGVSLPTETLLRAAALVLAEAGRPAMLEEVELFLARRTDRAAG